MTLPLSTTTVDVEYSIMRNMGINAQSYVLNVQRQIAANSVQPTDFLSALSACVSLLAMSSAVATNATLVANLVAYANLVVPGTTFTATSMAGSIAALQALVTAMVAEYPKDANGHLIDRSFAADGSINWIAQAGTAFPQTAAAASTWLGTLS
jgi:hypothetical protein